MFFLFILLGLDVAVLAFHYFFGASLGFFHIEKEQNLASVYSGLLLVGTGVSGFSMWAMLRHHARRSETLVWLLLGLGMLFMGVDEMAVIHERLGFVLNNQTGLGGYQGESFNWVIYYTPAIIAFVFVAWGVLRILFRDTRSYGWYASTGIAILFLALGLEVWGGKLLAFPIYQTVLVLEEFFEMLGETFFLTAIAGMALQTFRANFRRIV